MAAVWEIDWAEVNTKTSDSQLESTSNDSAFDQDQSILREPHYFFHQQLWFRRGSHRLQDCLTFEGTLYSWYFRCQCRCFSAWFWLATNSLRYTPLIFLSSSLNFHLELPYRAGFCVRALSSRRWLRFHCRHVANGTSLVRSSTQIRRGGRCPSRSWVSVEWYSSPSSTKVLGSPQTYFAELLSRVARSDKSSKFGRTRCFVCRLSWWLPLEQSAPPLTRGLLASELISSFTHRYRSDAPKLE